MYSSNNSLNGNNLITIFPSFESNSTNSSKDEHNSPFPFTLFPFHDEFHFQDNHQFFQHHRYHDDVDDFQIHHPPTPHHPIVMNNANKEHLDQPLVKVNKTINIPSAATPGHYQMLQTGLGDQVLQIEKRKRLSTAAPGHQVVQTRPGDQVTQIQKRKRCGGTKRDRHSKIKTAKGLRDRRMRLSLEVAKRFFGLQDMLGFEKASKTVEWLLNQSKIEIKHLEIEKNLPHFSTKSVSSTSECEEGVSSLDNDQVVISENQEQKVVPMKKRRNSSTNKVCRKSVFNSIGREKARERARERTRIMKASKQCNDEGGTKTNLNCWNPFESVESTNQSQSLNHHSSFNEDEEIIRSKKSKDNSSQSHEDHNSLFMMLNSLNNLQEQHQFEEFNQSMEKCCWDGYMNSI